MEIKKLKELIDFLRENQVAEYEYEEEGKHIKLTLADLKYNSINDIYDKEKIVQKSNSQNNNKIKKEQNQEEQIDDEDLVIVRSPIVGTFYSAPQKDAKPFVSKGEKVKKGDVLCIVEAMKVMNEIESPVNGIVEDILVENGEVVEFDKIIIKIKKD